jgi:hypothetical protein
VSRPVDLMLTGRFGNRGVLPGGLKGDLRLEGRRVPLAESPKVRPRSVPLNENVSSGPEPRATPGHRIASERAWPVGRVGRDRPGHGVHPARLAEAADRRRPVGLAGARSVCPGHDGGPLGILLGASTWRTPAPLAIAAGPVLLPGGCRAAGPGRTRPGSRRRRPGPPPCPLASHSIVSAARSDEPGRQAPRRPRHPESPRVGDPCGDGGRRPGTFPCLVEAR